MFRRHDDGPGSVDTQGLPTVRYLSGIRSQLVLECIALSRLPNVYWGAITHARGPAVGKAISHRLSIVSGIISLARTLGLEIVAEGIETGLQLQRLRELGCERALGFLIAQPLRRGEPVGWLEANEAHSPVID